MQISGPTQLHGAQPLRAPHATRTFSANPSAGVSATPRDELSLSSPAQWADRVSDLPEVRLDRVREIRAALAAGSYETADKLDGALERLLDEIG